MYITVYVLCGRVRARVPGRPIGLSLITALQVILPPLPGPVEIMAKGPLAASCVWLSAFITRNQLVKGRGRHRSTGRRSRRVRRGRNRKGNFSISLQVQAIGSDEIMANVLSSTQPSTSMLSIVSCSLTTDFYEA